MTYNIALIIDEIFEVDGLDKHSINNVPTFGTKIKSQYIKFLARYNDKEVYILNITKVLDVSKLSQQNFNEESVDNTSYIREIKKKKTIVSSDYEFEDDEDDEIDVVQLVSANQKDTNQYLIFEGPFKQYYGKNISKIEEILASKDLNIQKNFDDNMIAGTVNIRGEMLTLVNFDKWLGLNDVDNSIYEEIIIVNIGKHKFGLLVRSTEYIITIDTKDMSQNSDTDSKSTFISQIQLDGKDFLCTIVDSDKILIDVFKSKQEQTQMDLDNIDSKIDTDKMVLFADDSGLIRNTVKNVAKKLGLKYKIFENGKLLYQFLKQNNIQKIGLIVTDLEMPIMDGKELVVKIRENNSYDNINIIVYTNMANDVLEKKILEIGASKVVTKIDIDSLSESIREYIIL